MSCKLRGTAHLQLQRFRIQHCINYNFAATIPAKVFYIVFGI